MGFDAIDAYVAELGGRRLAAGEWGLDADGFAIGVRASRGLVRAQCRAGPAGCVEPAELLRRNRSLELVRYASTRAGEVWVVGEILARDGASVDRLLGALVEAARVVRGDRA